MSPAPPLRLSIIFESGSLIAHCMSFLHMLATHADVAEQGDAADSKSAPSNRVLVRFQSSASIPNALEKLDLGRRESPPCSTVARCPILEIWSEMRSSNRGALAQPKFQFLKCVWYIRKKLDRNSCSMQWVDRFSLFLFDFDGILVNTEPLHFQAYREICALWGRELLWTFEEYCQRAHFSSQGVKAGLNNEYPDLFKGKRSWELLYQEKKRIYRRLLHERAELMPGAALLLSLLEAKNIQRCVVTNSSLEDVRILCSFLPCLETIPHWFTREKYNLPKPHPDGYITAIHALKKPYDRAIGFEDTFRGLQALRQVPCRPVVISSYFKPAEAISHFDSFESIPANWEIE